MLQQLLNSKLGSSLSLCPIFSRIITRHLCELKPHVVLLGACAPFQTSEGRKTKTSSDASQEAPERARKDTPKEVNCTRAVTLLCVFPSVVSQAVLRRVPCPQGWRSRGDRPTRCRGKRDHPCAGNLFASAIRGTPLFALAEIVYQKSGLRTRRLDKNQDEPGFRQTSRPQARPGSLSRVSA